MLSPENLPSRPLDCDFLHQIGQVGIREGRAWVEPSGLVLIAQLLRSSGLAALDGSDLRAQNVCRFVFTAQINLETFTICRRSKLL